MSEKKDITKLSKAELVEMLQRQEKLLLNRTFINSLPDKGDKIHKLVGKLKEQIALREQADDLSNRFNRISLAQSRNASQKVELDSDDDENCNDDDKDDDNAMVVNEKGALAAPTQDTVEEESSKENTPKKQSSGKWAYDSAVTHVKPHAFEKAKVLSLDESRELQLKQKEEYEALKAKHAAEKLFEHIDRSSIQTFSTSYEFSSMEAKMKYREDDEENVQENEEDSESEAKLYEQEHSDED
ncbi:DNA-directed RNA polymerase II subunit GRINL1A-like [Actinia tenebrosa]|uniref:DNA-directed RNA polymerase II subunit GRINL1A n=1 Tax=Actinia tenebrosa TaxID=6105 RepID=A0A6P8HES3_ACTTE|nr:DNA-directed RNA polymerase II subunit GRINL1A-like [Actinia tenebrosa]